MTGRDAIYGALFNVLGAIVAPGNVAWAFKTRRIMLWDEVPAASQPALIFVRGRQETSQKRAFGAARWLLRAYALVYFQRDTSNDPAYYPGKAIDDWLDVLDAALQPFPQQGTQTLGGLVQHCWIDGEVVYDEGVQDLQAVIAVPFAILY